MPGAIVELATSGRQPAGRRCSSSACAYVAATFLVFWLAGVLDGGALDVLLRSRSATRKTTPESAAARVADPRLQFGLLLRLRLRRPRSRSPFWHAPALVLWGDPAGPSRSSSAPSRSGATRARSRSTALVWIGALLVLLAHRQHRRRPVRAAALRARRDAADADLLDRLLRQPLVHVRRLLRPVRRRRRFAARRRRPSRLPHERLVMKKVAIVTGAGSGIGRASALALLEGRLPRRARRPPRRRARGDARAPPATAADRVLVVPTDVTDPAAVKALFARRQGQARPPRRAVQQRRHRRAAGAARGAHRRAVADRRRHQPDRRLPVHAAGVRADEVAVAARRPHHQQRLDLGARAAPVQLALHRDQARDHRPHQVDLARRPRRTTSPAARSTSATPRPR